MEQNNTFQKMYKFLKAVHQIKNDPNKCLLWNGFNFEVISLYDAACYLAIARLLKAKSPQFFTLNERAAYQFYKKQNPSIPFFLQ